MRYYLRVEDLATARGSDAAFAWTGNGPQSLAEDLERMLRTTELFDRWRAAQDEPDDVDASLGATDANAHVQAEERAHAVHVRVSTRLSHAVLRHRLRLMLGDGWALTDVQA